MPIYQSYLISKRHIKDVASQQLQLFNKPKYTIYNYQESHINFLAGDKNMHAEAHINALSKKHAVLDEKIHMEEARPAPDSTILHELKKEKLLLKDEIARLNT